MARIYFRPEQWSERRHGRQELYFDPSRKLRYNRFVLEPFSRDRIIEALQAMPPDATIDDAIERLLLLAKIEVGLAELDGPEGVAHHEAKRRAGL